MQVLGCGERGGGSVLVVKAEGVEGDVGRGRVFDIVLDDEGVGEVFDLAFGLALAADFEGVGTDTEVANGGGGDGLTDTHLVKEEGLTEVIDVRGVVG